MWDTFIGLMQWPFLDVMNYVHGGFIVWAIVLVVTTICEDEAISLLTPFKILGNIFDKEVGSASVIVGGCWGVVLWALVFLVLPGMIIGGIWSFGKGKLGGELGMANQARGWLESKVLFDFSSKKDTIK
jgi:hypothetical protein